MTLFISLLLPQIYDHGVLPAYIKIQFLCRNRVDALHVIKLLFLLVYALQSPYAEKAAPADAFKSAGTAYCAIHPAGDCRACMSRHLPGKGQRQALPGAARSIAADRERFFPI